MARNLGNLHVSHAVQILSNCVFDGEPRAALSSIQNKMLQTLAAPYAISADDRRIAHALGALNQARHNRGAFKRFMHAWSAGRHDYIWRHPLSRRWMEEHTALSLNVWRRGIPYEAMTLMAASGSVSRTILWKRCGWAR